MNTKTVTGTTNTNTRVKMLTRIGMLGAIATVLMLFEIPLSFAPAFYKMDFSEIPVLIGCFVMGPAAGVAIEFVKILLNFVINGTMTAGVGEMANFLLGVSFVAPAGLIYKKYHTRKGAVAGMAVGTVLMIILGCFLNAFVLLPVYGKAFGMPLDALIGMGTAVNKNITSLFTFVAFAVAPFNLLKGVIDGLIVFLIYKKIRPIFSM